MKRLGVLLFIIFLVGCAKEKDYTGDFDYINRRLTTLENRIEVQIEVLTKQAVASTLLYKELEKLCKLLEGIK